MKSSLKHPGWKRTVDGLIAAEVSRVARYCARCVQLDRMPLDPGYLLSQVAAPERAEAQAASLAAPAAGGPTLWFMNGNLNSHFDIQGLLAQVGLGMRREDRLAVVLYNPYFRSIYWLANLLRLRRGELPTTFVTRSTLSNLARLAGLEVVRLRPVAFVPFKFLGLGTLMNRWFAGLPVLRHLSFAMVATFRKRPERAARAPSLTVVIPARNEKGNIAAALQRMPDLGCEIEVIFVEGHSKDGTWEEIQRVSQTYSGPLKVRSAQQEGKGKVDAVRKGFSMATGDLLTILDADLTMPPEMLGRFYEAYRAGLGDFINGSRLVYPMEGEAMRFLNLLGNVFFAKALSSVLGVRIGDSLCGTKLVSRADYARFVQWRQDFGDFDPFGDFELIFPAAELSLGVADVPVRYLARTYGTTNIHRFRHGLILLRMTLVGFFRLRLGARP